MKKKSETVKGFKIFDKNFKCKDFQFKEGETYIHKGSILICSSGFHFCLKASHCFSYYTFDPANIVCEVEALGEVATHSEDSKCCTNKIKIVRRLKWDEVLLIANDGSNNTGHSNSGDSNSGDRNSGDSNSGYRNSGAFCTDNNPKVFLFDKLTKMLVKEWEQSRAYRIMSNNLNFTFFIDSNMMSKEEKEANPKHKTTGGYLKTIPYKDGWKNMWGNLSDADKKEFTTLENFDPEKFEEITGIRVK